MIDRNVGRINGDARESGNSSIDTHISNLRNKLDKAGNESASIQNQRGVGYVLVPARRSG